MDTSEIHHSHQLMLVWVLVDIVNLELH